MTPEQYAKKLSNNISLISEDFADGMKAVQRGIYGNALKLVKNLEINSQGYIIPNAKNIKALKVINTSIENELISSGYKNNVDKFVSSFTDIKNVSDGYFYTLVGRSFVPDDKLYEYILKSSIDATAEKMLGAGIQEALIDPIKENIRQGITGSSKYEDMVESLSTFIKGDESLGAMERYAGGITTDSLNMFAAEYSQGVTNDLGFEYFYYQGALMNSSRPFCRDHAGGYYSKEEVENFGNGIGVYGDPIDTTGFIEGTNSSNIMINRGGYNCGHHFIPVGEEEVPADVIERNKA